MSVLSVQPTFPIFTEADGQPLENGYIWIGTANLDPQVNPIAVYWDAELTQLAAQPIRTMGGYPVNAGTPARLYVNSDYSIRVMDRNGSVVYSAAAAKERYNDVIISSINAENVLYDAPFSGYVQRNAEKKFSEIVTVDDFGAVGGGIVDDTTALLSAFSSGSIVDGLGKTYAINGAISPPAGFKGARNITIKQIANKTLSNVQTLDLRGLSGYFLDNVEINMGDGVVTLFSDDGNNGVYCGGTQVGSLTTYAKNFNLNNVRVTGNGCGTGIHIRHASNFTASNLCVFDRISGASPDPTNDSQNGIEITNCYDFSLSSSETRNLKTRLSGVDSKKWTRGFLFTECRNFTVDSCRSIDVDQGFDFSGAYVALTNYTGNRNWCISNSSSSSCLTYGFKFANVTRDGVVNVCTAYNSGSIGFVVSPSGVSLPVGLDALNTSNINFIGCKVVNVLGNGWSGPNSQGFRIMSNGNYPTWPRNIKFISCNVSDVQTVSTTLNGFASDSAPIENPTAGFNSSIANYCSNCTCENVQNPFDGIGTMLCQITGTSSQTIANNTWTSLNWDFDIIDNAGLHSTSSNNSNIYIKSSGWYSVVARVQFVANATGSRQVRLLKNGSVIDRTTVASIPSSAVNSFIETSCFVYLVTGDNLRVEAFQNSGTLLLLNANESIFSANLS